MHDTHYLLKPTVQYRQVLESETTGGDLITRKIIY
jgi:hypothetical protein